MNIRSLVESASDDELTFISSLDYGQDQKRHHDALSQLVTEQRGQLQEGQHWFPYEVIELGSHALTPDHEREFAICTLLVIAAVRSGFDQATDLVQKFQDRAEDYDRLPETLRQEILDAYQQAQGAHCAHVTSETVGRSACALRTLRLLSAHRALDRRRSAQTCLS